MVKRVINIGQTVNDKKGDQIRTAFDKVNQNFTELYNMVGNDTPTDRLTNGDKQLVLNVDSNTPDRAWVEFPSAFGESIYVQGAGIGAPSSPIAVFGMDRVLLSTNNTANSDRLDWDFDKTGTLTVPAPFPRTFTAVLDTDHMSHPDPAVAIEGSPWQMDVTFSVVDGQIETHIEEIFPILNNPGYVSDYAFSFTEADHGILDYTFTIELQNVVHPGGAGWTANVSVSSAPKLPASITSEQTLVLHGDTGVVISNGTSIHEEKFKFIGRNLILPGNGDIRDYLGNSVLNSGLSVADFGEGFSLNGADKIVTNKLYSTNETQPNQHYRLELDTNGVVVLPDQSIINGATLRVVPGTGELNYAALAAGPDINNPEKTWIWADANGAWIETDSYDGQYTWHFDNNGLTQFPAVGGNSLFIQGPEIGSEDSSIAITTKDSVIITADVLNKSKQWQFGADGSLTVPSPTTSPFLLTFSSSNYVATEGKPALELTGTAWSVTGAYVYGPTGEVQLVVENFVPSETNPGYDNGDTFTFDSSVHGITGYTLSISLDNFIEIPEQGWTADIAASQAPAYPSTIKSNGAVKITADTDSWAFGTDGKLITPNGGGAYLGKVWNDTGEISLVGGAGGYAALVDSTGNQWVDADEGGVQIGTDYENTGGKTWFFNKQGDLTLPPGGDIKNSAGYSVLGGAGSSVTVKGIAQGSVTINPSPSEVGSTGLTQAYGPSNADDDFTLVTLPFDIIFCGKSYNTVYIGSNSYLTFDAGSSFYGYDNTTNADVTTDPQGWVDNVELPGIFITSADNSYQQVFAGTHPTDSSKYVVRYEGTNSTSGTAGSPTIVWEAIFDSNSPAIIVINVVTTARDNTNSSSFFTDSGQVLDTFPATTESSWIFTTDNLGTAVASSITFTNDRTSIVNTDGDISVKVGVPNIGDIRFDGSYITNYYKGDSIYMFAQGTQTSNPDLVLGYQNYNRTIGSNQTEFRSSVVDINQLGVGISLIKNGPAGNADHEWLFDFTGKLKLPNGGDIVDNNGNSVLGSTANTGDITFNANDIIGSNTMGPGVINLVPDNSLKGTGQYVQIYPTNAFDYPHVHIEAGIGGELYIGNDSQYVKTSNTGAIITQSHNDNVVVSTMTSPVLYGGGDGTYTVATVSAGYVTFTSNIFNGSEEGTITFSGVNNMTQLNGNTYYYIDINENTCQLFVDEQHQTPLDTSGFSSWDQNLTPISFTVTQRGENTGSNSVHTNDTDALNIPVGATGNYNGTDFIVVGVSMADVGDGGGVVIYVDPTDLQFTGGDEITFNYTVGMFIPGTGSAVLTTGVYSNKYWTFATDGSLTLPGGINAQDGENLTLNVVGNTWSFEQQALVVPSGTNIVSAGSIGLYSTGDAGIGIGSGLADFSMNNGRVYLNTNNANGQSKTWSWDETGVLTFPDGGSLRVGMPPASSKGQVTDKAGTVAFDGSYLYYCTQNYVSTDILLTVNTNPVPVNDTYYGDVAATVVPFHGPIAGLEINQYFVFEDQQYTIYDIVENEDIYARLAVTPQMDSTTKSHLTTGTVLNIVTGLAPTTDIWVRSAWTSTSW